MTMIRSYGGLYLHVFFDGTSINIRHDGSVYEVSLDRCRTASEVLDWIHQLHTKSWLTAEMEREFIDMLFELISVELWSGAGFKDGD